MPKVVRFHEVGDAEVLRIDEMPMPEAGPGEVVMKVEAFGLNRAEIMFRKGDYPQYDPELPSALGYEAAGTVLAVGAGVASVCVGDRVSTIPSFKMGRYWSYGEVARVPEHAAVAFPDRLSWAEAAAIWMPYMTAWGGLIEYGKLQSGEHVVIRAASSSVGLAAIQIARQAGAIAIAVTRGPEKKPIIAAQGAAHIIATSEENMADRILEITGGGAQMIFDPVAGATLEELARATAYHGRIFVYGRLANEPAVFPVNHGLSKGLTVKGYSLFEVINFPHLFARAKQRVTAGLASGAYHPVIDSTFTLDQIVAAHRHMESNVQRGKIVVTI